MGRSRVGQPAPGSTFRLPHSLHAPAARVIHLRRPAPAARVIHFYRPAIVQAHAPEVFHLNYRAIEQSTAARVIRLNRRNIAPGVTHRSHPFIGQAFI